MLTVDLDYIGARAGASVLDIGCGNGRHSFEALKRGCRVVAGDVDPETLAGVASMAAALWAADAVPPSGRLTCAAVDATALPFDDDSFDIVIASEVLEHVVADEAAVQEMARVLRPSGMLVASVPRWWPERVCWSLSREYHDTRGGHVRIYRKGRLAQKTRAAALEPVRVHHAHALHTPYWWLKCALGIDRTDAAPVRLYHRFLVWDIEARPRSMRAIERVLDPLAGKSLVLYARPRSRETR